jgi:hypothetical protein
LDLAICLGCQRILNFDPNDILKLQEGYDRLGTEPLPPPPPVAVVEQKQTTTKLAAAYDRETKETVAPLSIEGVPSHARRSSTNMSSATVNGNINDAKNAAVAADTGSTIIERPPLSTSPPPALNAPPTRRRESMTQGPNERARASSTIGGAPTAVAAPATNTNIVAPVATGTSVTAPSGKKEPNHAQYVLGYGMIDFTKDPNYADRDFNVEEQQRELKSLIVTNDLNENAFND